ncbi:MAG: Phosphoglycolate phosphatase [Pseudomonadota bacterium]|jgi:phosphoglycolate phosphatase
MGLSRFRAAIVDLDGTMVDTLGDFEVALNRTLADLDLPPVTRALVERTVGKGSEHLIRTVLAQQMALPEAQGLGQACPAWTADSLYPRAWALYQRHYLAINGDFAEVYPGVADGLQALRDAGLALACLTNKPLAFARGLLATKGLDAHFSQVFGGDSFARKKPDPLPLLKTCEALGLAPSQALMVGDSSNDAQAGHAAGCGVVLVTYGYNHGQPIRETPALAWVDALSDIPAALASR